MGRKHCARWLYRVSQLVASIIWCKYYISQLSDKSWLRKWVTLYELQLRIGENSLRAALYFIHIHVCTYARIKSAEKWLVWSLALPFHCDWAKWMCKKNSNDLIMLKVFFVSSFASLCMELQHNDKSFGLSWKM